MAEDQQRMIREWLRRGVFQAGRAEIAEEMERRLEFAPKPAGSARNRRVPGLRDRV